MPVSRCALKYANAKTIPAGKRSKEHSKIYIYILKQYNLSLLSAELGNALLAVPAKLEKSSFLSDHKKKVYYILKEENLLKHMQCREAGTINTAQMSALEKGSSGLEESAAHTTAKHRKRSSLKHIPCVKNPLNLTEGYFRESLYARPHSKAALEDVIIPVLLSLELTRMPNISCSIVANSSAAIYYERIRRFRIKPFAFRG